jgi:hypothetical protein
MHPAPDRILIDIFRKLSILRTNLPLYLQSGGTKMFSYKNYACISRFRRPKYVFNTS